MQAWRGSNFCSFLGRLKLSRNCLQVTLRQEKPSQQDKNKQTYITLPVSEMEMIVAALICLSPFYEEQKY
jgi:hypothetical protein